MKAKRKTMSDHARGYFDGFALDETAREEAHERMQATVRRHERLACQS